jgi:hypothetical protein
MNKLDKLTNGAASRRTLLRAAAASVVGGVAYSSLFRAAAQEPESVQNILDVTATVEQFGVTFLSAGIESAEQGNFNMPWPPEVLAIVKAARAQEQFHLDFFESLGGRALVDTFTIPPEALTDFNTFFSAVVVQEAVEIAGQLAAIEMFTELDRPDLVKVSFQYAAEEAEHRVLANYTRGARPPNNVAFEPMMFETAEGMLDSMRERGLIGGTGMAVEYPGPGEIDASNVTNRTPDGPAAC